MQVSSRGVGRLILGISLHTPTPLSLQILAIRVGLELGASPAARKPAVPRRTRNKVVITFFSP
jgi:hypothetical protein